MESVSACLSEVQSKCPVELSRFIEGTWTKFFPNRQFFEKKMLHTEGKSFNLNLLRRKELEKNFEK